MSGSRVATYRVARCVCALALMSAAYLSAGVGSAAASVTHTGYLTAPDGASLNYTVVRPDGPGPFPTVMVYDGYEAGYAPMTDNHDEPYMDALAAKGFAVMGVNMPATGCSGGNIWPAFSKEWGQDGAFAVTWAATQPWSNGKVGMLGDSFPAFGSLWVAAEHPRGLVAIAPDGWTGNFYDDVYPGGIYNDGFPDFFDADQETGALPNVQAGIQAGDTQCVKNYALDGTAGRVAVTNGGPPAVFAATLSPQYPYDDGMWTDVIFEPQTLIRGIDVPVLAANSYQDYVVDAGTNYFSMFNPRTSWFVETNGQHVEPMVSQSWVNQVVRFLDHYVAGTDNGWENTPHVQLWHETAATSTTDVEPSWVTSYQNWPVPTTTRKLFLSSGNALRTVAPAGAQATDTYRYPLPASSMGQPQQLVGGPAVQDTWTAPVASGGNVAYTTPPLAHDVDIFGSSSLNLWVASTARNTDLQVTISEVRPDGQEQYVQRGWLRMSMRKLTPPCPAGSSGTNPRTGATCSTVTWPRPTYQKADVRKLAIGVPTYARIPILPVEHLFRAGSSIRISIEAPVGVTGLLYSFRFNPTPAINTLYHDQGRPSGWVFDTVPVTGRVPAYPSCNTVAQEPCRTNNDPVPSGTLTIG